MTPEGAIVAVGDRTSNHREPTGARYHPLMLEFPDIAPGEPLRISASTFVAFRQCPDNALARLQGEWGPESRAAFSGGLAHRLFAKHLTDGPIAATDLNQVCRSEIGASNLNYKLGALGMKPSELGNVIEEVGAIYERFKRFPGEGFEGAEVAIQVEPAEGLTLVGSVDAVFRDDRGVKLVDWKTGELGEVDDQLHFYALLWALDRDDLPGAVEAVSVRTGERASEVPSSATVTETAAQVAEMVDEVRSAWANGRGIERRGGPWCRYCALLDRCVEGRAAVLLGGGPKGP